MIECKRTTKYIAIQFTGDNVDELIQFGRGDIKYTKIKGFGYKAKDRYVLKYHEPPEHPFSHDEPSVTTIHKGDYCVAVDGSDDDIIEVFSENQFLSVFEILKNQEAE